MKTFTLLPRLFVTGSLMIIFATSVCGAISLPNTDTFTNSTNSWTNGTSINSTQYQINKDETATKTYDFGVANANKIVTITFDYWLDGGWETSGANQDYLNITANGDVTTLSYGDGVIDPVVGNVSLNTVILDSLGKLVLSINPDTTADGENIRVDNIVIAEDTVSITTTGRPFTLRHDRKLFGDVAVIGNTVLCESNGASGCQEPTGIWPSDGKVYNDWSNLILAPSSYSTLTLPTDVVGGNVKWARLYWQGRKAASTTATFSTSEKNSAKAISIRKGNSGTFTPLIADVIDFETTGQVGIYSANVDVTSFVQSKGAGSYYIQDLYTNTGKTESNSPPDGLGAYGAWVLVVVYENPSSTTFKDIAIFDGYKKITGTTVEEFSVEGFYTPKSPALVDSKLYLFVGEGDKNVVGDNVWLRGDKQASYGSAIGTFDSRIDVSAARLPNLTNNSGIDIQTYNVGTTAGALGLIGNEEKKAWLKFGTSGDSYFPSLAIFATDLYLPNICYDYSFSQNNRFFPHDTSATAHINGYLLNTEPLSAQIMLKNRAIGSEAMNLKLRIEDINSTSQLQFYTNTTTLALQKTLPNSYYYNTVPTSDITTLTTADLKFNWLTSTNTLSYNESVFSTFKLNPLASGQIDVPLHMYIDYDYTLDNTTYSLTNLALDSRIPRCVAAPSEYNPVEWIFNVVDSGLNPGAIAAGATNVKYNLPTQVANRPVDIKVVSFDPTTLDTVKAISAAVAIELIDVGGYLDTASSCADPNSAITKRAWLDLGDKDNNVTYAILDESKFGVGLNTGVSAVDFFKNVRENVAYRVSYNLADDNGSIKFDTKIEADGSKSYQLFNFPSYGGGVCAVDMDGNANNTDTIPSYCGNNANINAASWMSGAEYRTCMECIYGLKTRSVCSRDNFSIRPEAFDIKIKDPIGLAAIPYDANLSAGYLYRFDVNATNHIDGTATSGYSVWFDGANPDQNASLVWAPDAAHPLADDTTCNDVTSPSLQFYFANGKITAQNRNHANVGRYVMQMRDSQWTAVDQWPISHHNDANNWIQNTNDCAAGSAVPLYSPTGSYVANNVGCEISSNHNKLKAPTATYNDYNLSFRADNFNLSSIGMSTGTTFGTSAINQNVWTYMNNVVEDANMSVRYFGKIIAKGSNGETLNNFVRDCYAEPINLDLNLTFPTTTGLPNLRYRLQEVNASTNQIWNDTNDVILTPVTNTSFPLITIPQTSFLKNQNGFVDLNLSLNFDRNQTLPVNPIIVGLQNLQVKCQTSVNCSSNAEMIANHLPDANLTTNSNVTFAYGRLLTKDIRVFGNIAFTANGWYEVYNSPNLLTTQLQPSKNGVLWYINQLHDDLLHGDSVITRLESSGVPSTVNLSGNDINGIEAFSFSGSPSGTVPYNGKAHVDTDSWLWYAPNALTYSDPSNLNLDCLTHPCFNVTVMPAIGATGSAKSTNTNTKASKASTRGTGWHSTTDYAPAIR